MNAAFGEGRPLDRADRRAAAVLFFFVVVVVGFSAQSLGFTRDEGYYFKAGMQYAEWFRALPTSPVQTLASASIDKHLSYNPEHPFLLKASFALSWLGNDVLGTPFLQHNALRFPAWITAGLAVLFVFLLARQVTSRRGAIVAALLFVSMPHVFWHMHVACFDVGVTAAHAALVWAFLRFRHTVRGAVVVGVVFGIAGAVKHNVLPMPALLALNWLVFESHQKDNKFRIPLVFLSLALVAPVVYVLLWPYLWPDVGGRFSQYIAFHLHHEHYPILYFGDLLTAPPFPWLFPVVMSLVTIPVPVLALMGGGVALALARVGSAAGVLMARLRSATTVALAPGLPASLVSPATASLLLLNAAVPVFLIMLPSTPIFGGTKHWMNALPFLCVLGALALEEGAARLRLKPLVVVALAAGVILPGFVMSARVWPYGLGSYNEIAGFSRGGANVGMQRTFWGYETRAALPFINEHAPKNGRLHFGDVNADSHRMYGRDKLLRDDIRFSGTVRAADVAHVEPQGEFKQQQLDVWNEWQTRVPDRVISAEGVPLSTVTLRPRGSRR